MKTLRTLFAAALALVFIAVLAPATDYDLRQGGSTSTGPLLERTIDFAAHPMANGDTIKLFHIPAGAIVSNVGIYVQTACTVSTSTLDVGDSTDADGYMDGIAMGTAAANFNSFRAGNTLQAGVVNFYDEDVAASQSAAEWGTQDGTDVGGALKRVVMPWAGSIIGISAYTATAHTTGTLTADATIGGTVTGLQAIATAGVATGYGSQAMGLDNFAAGNAIGAKVTTGSTFAATTTDWRVSVFYVSDGSAVAPTAYMLGKKYTAADYLVIKSVGILSAGKVRFRVALIPNP